MAVQQIGKTPFDYCFFYNILQKLLVQWFDFNDFWVFITWKLIRKYLCISSHLPFLNFNLVEDLDFYSQHAGTIKSILLSWTCLYHIWLNWITLFFNLQPGPPTLSSTCQSKTFNIVNLSFRGLGWRNCYRSISICNTCYRKWHRRTSWWEQSTTVSFLSGKEERNADHPNWTF